MTSIRPRDHSHILVFVGAIAIIGLFMPLFMGGGNPIGNVGVDGIVLIENAFQIVSNSSDNTFNATADQEKDILQLLAGAGMTIDVNGTADTITFSATAAGGGETNLGASVGGATGTIFRDKTGVTLNFKTLSTAGDGIVITNNADTVGLSLNNIPKSEISLSGTWITADLPASVVYNTQSIGVMSDVANGCTNGQLLSYQTSNSTWICTTGGGGGEINTMSSPALGETLVLTKAGSDLPIKGISVSGDLTISSNSTDITIGFVDPGGSGEINTASSDGVGETLVNTKSGVNLPFKGLAVSGDLSIASNATDVIISYTNPGGSGVTSINSDAAAAQTILGTTNELTVSDTGVGQLTLDVGTDIVQIDQANTYTDANIQTFTDDDFRIQDNTGGQFYTFSTGNIVADRVVSIPILATNDVFVFQGATQTLTAKSIDADTNTLTNIENADIKVGAAIAWAKINKSGSLIGDLGNVANGCTNTQVLSYQTSNSTWICSTPAGGAENTSASNVGTGLGVFNTEVGDDLRFNSILGGTGIDVSDTTDDITIAIDTTVLTTSSSIHDLGNVTATGCAVGEILKVSGTTWQCAVDNDGGSGEVNTASSSGVGETLVLAKATFDLPFKGIAVGGDLTIASNATDVTISYTTPAGSGITSINGDATAAQVLSGTTNQVVITDTGVGTLSWDVGTDVVQEDIANTFVNGNLQTFQDDDFRIADITGTEHYIFSVGDISADRVVSIPVLTTADVFVMQGATQTLTAKSIDADTNTLTNIENADIKVGAAIAWAKLDKTGSSIHDLGNVTSTGCAVGEILKVVGSSWQCATLSGTGEVNTASNVGSGVGIFDNKNVFDLEFNSIIGGDGITVADTTQDITIDVDNTVLRTTSSIHDLGNVTSTGCAVGEILKVTGTTWQCATLSGTGEVNTISSIGGGTFALTATTPKSGVDLRTISVSNGDGMNAALATDVLTLAVASTVAQTNQVNSYTDGNLQTFTDDDIEFSNPAGTFQYVLSTGAILANYTISLPVLVANDVFVFQGATQTLTAKSIDADTNTLTNIENADIKAGAAIAWTKISKTSSSIHDLGNVTATGCTTGEILKVSGTTWQCAADAGGADATTGLSLGAGSPIFVGESGDELQFDSVIGGTGIDITDTTDDLTFSIDATVLTTSSSIHDLGNVTSTGCTTNEILKVSGSSWICAADDTGAGGEVNTASSSGVGESLVLSKATFDLPFKGIAVSGDLTIASNATDITISYTDPAGITASTGLTDTADIAYLNTANEFLENNIQTLHDDDLHIKNIANTFDYILSTGAIVADRTVSLPVLATNDVFVFQGATQTLTAKSIDADTNTLTNIENADIKAGAAIAWTKISKTGSLIGDLGDVANGCTNDQVLKYQTSNSTWICSTPSGGAENTSASNLGTGFGIFSTEVGDDLRFDSLIGGTGIDITDTTDDLTFSIDATVLTTSSSIHSLGNVTSTGCTTNEILKVSGSSWICAADNTGAGGETNTMSSPALGESLVLAKAGSDLPIKGISVSGDLTIASNTTDITISYTDPPAATIAENNREVFTCSDGQSQITNTPNKRTVSGTNMDYVVCDFDTTTAETIIWSTVVPDGFLTDINVTVNAITAANTAASCWDISFMGLADGDALNSGTFSGLTGACTSVMVVGDLETAVMTAISTHGIAAGDVVYLKLDRDVAADSNTGDVGVISIEVSWNN